MHLANEIICSETPMIVQFTNAQCAQPLDGQRRALWRRDVSAFTRQRQCTWSSVFTSNLAYLPITNKLRVHIIFNKMYILCISMHMLFKTGSMSAFRINLKRHRRTL